MIMTPMNVIWFQKFRSNIHVTIFKALKYSIEIFESRSLKLYNI